MNVLDQLTIKQTPFTFAYAPQEIVMSEREISVLPALVSELVDMSIDKVKPLEKVGRVMIFDVMPHKRKDPPLIFCRDVDLKEYYFLWGQVVDGSYDISRSRLLYLYDEMIKSLNIAKLQTDEAAFMFIELLKFKNEYVRRA
jgi:hypothetical protein